MNRIFKTMMLSVAILTSFSAFAQTKVNESTTVYELSNSKLHVFQTGDPLGDVSFIIEGEKGLVILEQPLFYESIAAFDSYVQSLNKPIDKVIANYHQGGLSNYPSKKIMMPEAMIQFGKGEVYSGIMAKFSKAFGDTADLQAVTKAKSFTVPSSQNWVGVEFEFSNGSETDFPAASILIDNSAFYTHFAPSKSHASTMLLDSPAAVDAMITELTKIKNSGAKYIFGSHGLPATMEDVEFNLEYMLKVKELLASCANSDIFGQRLMVAYPKINGVELIKPLAKALYPNEVVDADTKAVRERMDDYLNVVSNLDMTLARELWAEGDNISIIAPRNQFFGFDGITKDFLLKAFSSFKSRKLSSLSEVINVYGNSANVQLYWQFDTVDAKGVAHQGRGRESLIFEKLNGVWKLVHVHYSPMPL
ncbi:MAG: nuclear transport factor 2 family protein [Rikenellaceae bacterium]